ncbi:MAG TPA: hypothetical protein VMS79_02455 [Methanomassiliicoccales archaeon]|nr:hypothetical protein [Methanomassiliicoccales archaeon]
MRCYFPGRRFPAYSVTGGSCALKCSHCEGRLLRGMRAVRDPDALMVEGEKLAREGGTGFLLSGGCDARGRVPLGQFVDAVRALRETKGLTANLHTGLLDKAEAEILSRSQADSYSVDLHQNPQVIRNVLHLDRAASSCSETLDALCSSVDGAVVPHVTVGLDWDGADALASIELASDRRVDGLVVLVFTPLAGTEMVALGAPSDEIVLEVLERARGMLDCPISLGCMRPRGNSALEIAAIESGIRDIAMPSRATLCWAEAHGIKAERIERCCAVHL